MAVQVLISGPGDPFDREPYLPYVWGLLKTYYEKNAADPANVHWLDPIYLHNHAEDLLAPYENERIDVLGLSCYVWNWQLQLRIARLVKARHPNCLIVAGGPHPDYKNKDFFLRNPDIDIVVARDGEVTFMRLLEKVALGSHDFSDVKGLYIKSSENGESISTGKAELPGSFQYSPYIEQSKHYEKIIRELTAEGKGFAAVWETNRGCPYRCSYCDWSASGTGSKLRRFEMERVYAEIEWLAKNGAHVLFSSDSNLGILPRDVDIVHELCRQATKYQAPKALIYNTAKNNPDRSVAIAKSLFDAKLCRIHHFCVQHTNETVLAATERANISIEKQYKVVEALREYKIPTDVHLILGIPGDTYETWKRCFSDLMDLGVHGQYFVYYYNLLPNAPASEPEFMKRWQMDCIERRITVINFLIEKHARDPRKLSPSPIVVSSASYSREDWIQMCTYRSFISALHCAGYTYLIALYLRFTHDIPYATFYDKLIEDLGKQEGLFRNISLDVQRHYRDFLKNEAADDVMEIQQLPNFRYAIPPAYWINAQIVLALEDFYLELARFLKRAFPQIPHIDSVVSYQKNVLISPQYPAQKEYRFKAHHDWINYFATVQKLCRYQPIAEPKALNATWIQAHDTECFDGSDSFTLSWETSDKTKCMEKWIEQTSSAHRTQTRSMLQKLIYVKAPTPALLQPVFRYAKAVYDSCFR